MNGLAFALVCLQGAVGALPVPMEMDRAGSWVSEHFTGVATSGHPEQPPAEVVPFFSFNYGGRASSSLLSGWQVERSSRVIDPTRTAYTLRYIDPATGLTVWCDGIAYQDYPTVEWTIHFRNDGTSDSPTLSEISAIDARFPRESGGEFVLHQNKGDNCVPESYAPFDTPLPPGSAVHVANTGGRPTQSAFPYFNVSCGDSGVIYVLSWAGQWASDFHHDAGDALRISGGQELTHFVLHPGEEVRGPMAVLQFWNGDRTHAQNVWRSWMLAHNVPRPGGSLPPSPELAACSSHQFGEMINANSDSQKFFIDKYLERGMKLDYWWMDAGWYWNTGGWPQTGTWEVDTKRFPGGLRPISDHAHDKGVNIIVWFEPERVAGDTWLTKNHPEWILGGAKGGLLNLGNAEARAWLTDHVDGLLTSEGIDLYRQDFNMDPLDAWRGNDTPERQGMTEIRHVEGYLAYWDELIRRHPNLLIDSCASGGRRNDLETLRRAVPLLRSDYIMEPTGNQAHTWALASWIPYFGTGTSKTSPYEILSVLCPHFTACWDMREEHLDYAELAKLVKQWKSCAPNFLGDYYPLTPYTLEPRDWIAWQFDLHGPRTGMVQAFRRESSKADSMRLPLQGLESDAEYEVTDLSSGTALSLSGRELMQSGLPVSIGKKPGATVLTYAVK